MVTAHRILAMVTAHRILAMATAHRILATATAHHIRGKINRIPHCIVHHHHIVIMSHRLCTLRQAAS
jgi:ABC-type transport system involved in Fe-S cluster assembly fused permease/ATPase subunit